MDQKVKNDDVVSARYAKMFVKKHLWMEDAHMKGTTNVFVIDEIHMEWTTFKVIG